MSCQLCIQRGKTWNGDDPICAFEGAFEENWNCATINEIRDICYEGKGELPHGVDYQYCDDMKYATIKINELELPNGSAMGLALWVSWYKSRGGTDAMWILDSHGAPRQPTEEELRLIIGHYAAKRALNEGKGVSEAAGAKPVFTAAEVDALSCERCEDCAPEFGCWNDAFARCRKRAATD